MQLQRIGPQLQLLGGLSQGFLAAIPEHLEALIDVYYTAIAHALDGNRVRADLEDPAQRSLALANPSVAALALGENPRALRKRVGQGAPIVAQPLHPLVQLGAISPTHRKGEMSQHDSGQNAGHTIHGREPIPRSEYALD